MAGGLDGFARVLGFDPPGCKQQVEETPKNDARKAVGPLSPMFFGIRRGLNSLLRRLHLLCLFVFDLRYLPVKHLKFSHTNAFDADYSRGVYGAEEL